jgi:hypothetical protein
MDKVKLLNALYIIVKDKGIPSIEKSRYLFKGQKNNLD